MGVFKRGKTYWIDFYDSNRSRVQESSRSSNKRDAEGLLALRKSEILRGVYKRPAKITFGELGSRYMEYAKGNKRSWLRDQQMLKQLTNFFGSERQIGEIIAADIEGYKLHRRREVSGSTVNRELALLKRMFNLAIDWDLYLGSNPVRKVKFFQDQYRLSLIEQGRREEVSRQRNAIHSRYRSFCLEYRLANRGDSFAQMGRCGFGEKSSDCLCRQNSQDSTSSDQFGSASSLRILDTRQKERVCFLQPRNRKTVR